MVPNEEKGSKRLLVGSFVFVVAILLLMLIFSWLLTKGVEDSSYNSPEDTNVQKSSDKIPTEPSNSNVTGGSSGAGTGTSNDASVETPSPAGGVDTNGNMTN
jgi:hypothetical protein